MQIAVYVNRPKQAANLSAATIVVTMIANRPISNAIPLASFVLDAMSNRPKQAANLSYVALSVTYASLSVVGHVVTTYTHTAYDPVNARDVYWLDTTVNLSPVATIPASSVGGLIGKCVFMIS